jgi:hypothetical protein
VNTGRVLNGGQVPFELALVLAQALKPRFLSRIAPEQTEETLLTRIMVESGFFNARQQ